jgi:hypothetical protein
MLFFSRRKGVMTDKSLRKLHADIFGYPIGGKVPTEEEYEKADKEIRSLHIKVLGGPLERVLIIRGTKEEQAIRYACALAFWFQYRADSKSTSLDVAKYLLALRNRVDVQGMMANWSSSEKIDVMSRALSGHPPDRKLFE